MYARISHKHTSLGNSGQQVLVDHFFLVDEVGSFVHQTHQLVEVVGPIVQHAVWVAVRGETNYAQRPVCLRLHGSVGDQVGEELLHFLLVEMPVNETHINKTISFYETTRSKVNIQRIFS